jgi:hypothetical protein
MSVFSEKWRTIAHWKGRERPLSESVRTELLMAICNAPLYYDDLRIPIEGVVTISDASPGGAGVCASLGLTHLGTESLRRAQTTNWQ